MKQAKSNKTPLVLIEWLDSHHVAGWHTSEPAEKPLLCRSVGWLVYDGSEAKTVAPHITEEDTQQRCGEMTIPTRSVVRMKVLQ